MSEPKRIWLSPPHMGGSELKYVTEAFESNFIAPLGPMVDRFERDFSELTGMPHCVALSSGTAAIHLALRYYGIGAGDTVFASTLTFIGSITPILYQNATPVFIDSSADSWNMDVDLLAQALADAKKQNKLPKAVLPTDLYGQSCDAQAIRALCDEYGVRLIIDAAESVGAEYQGKHTGQHGHAATYSFNGNKIMTTSGGGMLASHDAKLIEVARNLSQAARDPAPHYEHTTYGYNYRMSNIVAAIGVGQLEVLKDHVERRRAINAEYRRLLENAERGITFLREASYGRSNHWLSVILIDPAKAGFDRETARLTLEKDNIEARPVWKPMHLQPLFRDARVVGGTVSERLFRDGLCLPSGSAMTMDDVQRVCAHITKLLR